MKPVHEITNLDQIVSIRSPIKDTVRDKFNIIDYVILSCGHIQELEEYIHITDFELIGLYHQCDDCTKEYREKCKPQNK